MDGRPEIRCAICAEPIDLTVDLNADENGKAVHEKCYVRRIIKTSNSAAVRSLVAQWRESKLISSGISGQWPVAS